MLGFVSFNSLLGGAAFLRNALVASVFRGTRLSQAAPC